MKRNIVNKGKFAESKIWIDFGLKPSNQTQTCTKQNNYNWPDKHYESIMINEETKEVASS